MSKIEVNTVEPQCGTNLTIGASGDTITFPSGTTVVNNGSQTGFGRTGTVDWQTTPKTSDFTAANGEGYFVNTAGGAVTVTLPGSPSGGNIVSVSDYNSTASTNAITIARNGSNINGDAADYPITKSDSAVTLVYVDGTAGWTTVQTSNTTDNTSAFITATGGTVTCSGDYKIHTFTGPGTFTVSGAGTPAGSTQVDYMVIAGGGGGGGADGGGGGAGGFRESHSTPVSGSYTASPLATPTGITVSAQAYPITVGAGGAGAPGNTTCASNGVNSVFSTITSTGGGRGGSEPPSTPASAGNPGGSGGGASNGGGRTQPGGSGNTPPVSPPQGSNGAASLAPSDGSQPKRAGGGGGGAAGTGSGPNQNGDAGGGGSGTTTSITASPVTRAGGGGGGGRGAGGNAGPGGGGAGSNSSNPGSAGTANTGGGGGGFGEQASATGGTGGSGIVVIRYKFQ